MKRKKGKRRKSSFKAKKQDRKLGIQTSRRTPYL